LILVEREVDLLERLPFALDVTVAAPHAERSGESAHHGY
jgi:hypothetical protein